MIHLNDLLMDQQRYRMPRGQGRPMGHALMRSPSPFPTAGHEGSVPLLSLLRGEPVALRKGPRARTQRYSGYDSSGINPGGRLLSLVRG